jgi:hypothetical protein
MAKFVITGMPRSRTSWFAAYLTHGDTFCHHEAIHFNKSMDMPGYKNVGNSDSGYPLNEAWAKELGNHKIVIVHRDIDEVVESLSYVGIHDVRPLLEEIHRNMDKLTGLHVKFENVNEHLPDICEYLEVPYDEQRAMLFSALNIEPVQFTE